MLRFPQLLKVNGMMIVPSCFFFLLPLSSYYDYDYHEALHASILSYLTSPLFCPLLLHIHICTYVDITYECLKVYVYLDTQYLISSSSSLIRFVPGRIAATRRFHQLNYMPWIFIHFSDSDIPSHQNVQYVGKK